MPSIKQLKQEITEASYFDQKQKDWLIKGINLALEHLARTAIYEPKKPRAPKNASGLLTLQKWEEANGPLALAMFNTWINGRNLSRVKIAEMIAEFRNDMIARGKEYADFRAAFKNYLNKGYLSRTLQSCLRADDGGTTINKTGGEL